MDFVKIGDEYEKIPVLGELPDERVSAEDLRQGGWTVAECTVAHESGTAYFLVRTREGDLRWFPLRWD
jgi:hypothetical protein